MLTEKYNEGTILFNKIKIIAVFLGLITVLCCNETLAGNFFDDLNKTLDKATNAIDSVNQYIPQIQTNNTNNNTNYQQKQNYYSQPQMTNPEGATCNYATTNQNDPCYFYRQGVVLEEQGNYKQALESYNTAVNMNPNISDFYRKRGFVKYNLSDYEGALADCDAAINFNPDSSRSHNLKGNVLGKLEKNEEALTCYERAVAIDPDYTSAYSNIANTLSKLGRETEALSLLNQIIERHPEHINAYRIRGWVKQKLKDYEGAVNDYDCVLAKIPNDKYASEKRSYVQTLFNKNNDNTVVDNQTNNEQTANYSQNVIQNLEMSQKTTSVMSNQNLIACDFKEMDPCKIDVTGSDALWALSSGTNSSQTAFTFNTADSKGLSDFSKIKSDNSAYITKEAMKEIMGKLTQEQENAFDKKWSYYINSNQKAVKDYFDKAAPLFTKLVTAKSQNEFALSERDSFESEAKEAALWKNKNIENDALKQVQKQTEILLNLEKDVQNIVGAIDKLGNPPNVFKEMCKKRNNHKNTHSEAIAVVEEFDKTQQADKQKTINDSKSAFEKELKKYLEQPFEFLFIPEGCKAYQEGNKGLANDLESEYYYFAGSLLCPQLNKEINKTAESRKPLVSFMVYYYPNRKANTGWDERQLRLLKGADWDVFPSEYNLSGWEAKGVMRKNKDAYSYKNAEHLSFHKGVTEFWGEAENNIFVEFTINNIVESTDRYTDNTYLIKKQAQKNEVDAMNFITSACLKAMPHKAGTLEKEEKIEEFTPEQKMRLVKQAEEMFYRSNIAIIEANMKKDQEDYDREADPIRKNAFLMRIIAAQADIAAENDKINTLYTGEITHTRTIYDDLTKQVFIENIKASQEKFYEIQNEAALLRKEALSLPPVEREKLLKYIDSQVTGKTLATLDEATIKKVAEEVKTQKNAAIIKKQIEALPTGEKDKALQLLNATVYSKTPDTVDEAAVKKLGDAVFKKAQGYRELDSAKNEENAIDYEEYAVGSQRMKTAADIGMTVTSLFGGPLISAGYDVTCGYIEGGPKEAAKQMALQLGFSIVGKGTQKAANYLNKTDNAVDAIKTPKKIAAIENASDDLAVFAKKRKAGEKLVQDYENLQDKLQKAKKSNQSLTKIAEIQESIRQKTIAIHANPNAKNYLKYNGNSLTQKRFNTNLRVVHAEVETEFYKKMKSIGWDDFQVKEYRNAASTGSVGMDYDIGLLKKRTVTKTPDGKIIQRTETPVLLKNGKPVSEFKWQNDAELAWNDAYKEVTGESASKSRESMTSSVNIEAYKDLGVLTGDMSKIDSKWIQQTADVTRFKANHLMNDNTLTKFEKFQEICRGTSKDVNTKLLPLLNTPAQAKTYQHWKEINEVMDAFGRNAIDPVTAERKIAELTGGKSIPQVVEDMATIMESSVKLGGGKTSIYKSLTEIFYRD